jgi:hypothetical protein
MIQTGRFGLRTNTPIMRSSMLSSRTKPGGRHELGIYESLLLYLILQILIPGQGENPDELTLDVTAKTYRYLDEEATEG